MRHAIFRDGPKGVLMCLLVAVGLFVTSCSSDQPKNAATTTTDLGLSPEVAAAHAAIDAFRAAPTSIGTSTPLSKSPRKDIKVAGVACNVPGCILFLDSAKEAAAALGWGYQSFVTTGAPEDLQAQFELAFNSKPDAIISTGFDRTQIGSELDRAKQLGIVVVNAATRDDLQPPYVAINGGTEVFNRNATVLGNFIVADSGGKANVEIFSTKLIPILDVAANTVKTTIEAGCAACKVSCSRKSA